MTPRDRYREALTFGNPDKIPFSPGGPREKTRARWHSEGLPEGMNHMDAIFDILGFRPEEGKPVTQPGVGFAMIPTFDEEVLEHKNGHYIVRDWMGAITEISDEYDLTYIRSARDFVTRKWHRFPVQNRDDWEQMKTRYDIDAPGRFPDDWETRFAGMEKREGRENTVGIHFNAPFWQMREWCGFEGLCMLMIDDPEFVEEMAEFWMNFINELLVRITAKVELDRVGMSEDMAYKKFSMISPDMARRFLQPSYFTWMKTIKASGCPITDMDSDGYIGELIPIWIEAGINVCDPIEVAAHNDIVEFRQRFGTQIGYTGGIDKRAIAEGGSVITDELNRVIPPMLKEGGFIPSCDHGVPFDISWPNFIDYCRQLAQHTGWL
jgi:hypothetical protein